MKISKKSFFSFIIISFFFSLILVPGGLNTTLNAPAQVMAQADSLKISLQWKMWLLYSEESQRIRILVTILKFIRVGLSFFKFNFFSFDFNVWL